ncbi:helix-turn-helix domain-containing protein [Thalassospira lucentensis]|uniref:Transcriptional regulator n=1 Tax=Thalassospira lucentensis TaxID=168935 RepID=A0A358HU89_9PROT|nr:helix-turn-helix domain-containing protein [Thalassospira lucentensis]HBU98374.1 transcriptional regulator [Thalassospira lucentensis]HCW66343.1 transcriptional regulator [Thalassospira lucentensis]
MTPFGNRIRELRARNDVTLTDMASALQLSPAYLSALEHGHRGRPSPGLVQQICGYFNLVWDEVDDIKRLAQLSHPKITVDTAGLEPEATELANLLSERIAGLSDDQLSRLLDIVRERPS